MSSDLGSLYKELFKQYRLLHNTKTGLKVQQDFNSIWIEAKAKHTTKDELMKFAKNLLADYRQRNTARKSSNILYYYTATNKECAKKTILQSSCLVDSIVNEPCNSVQSSTSSALKHNITTEASLPNHSGDPKADENDHLVLSGTLHVPSDVQKRDMRVSGNNEEAIDDPAECIPVNKRIRLTPAQNKLKNEITLLEAELQLAIRRKNSVNSDGSEQRQITKLRDKIESCKKELHKKKQHALHAKKHRESYRLKLNAVCTQNPEVSNVLKLRAEPGRPRLEEKQPELLNTIIELAMFGASAEERRRCEILRSCRTLTDLHTRLLELGYNISRSGTYIRLLPRRYTTVEGKRHVITVPVKLSRPEADHHKEHSDQQFCVATIRSLETIASILGPKQVSFISQDDKARVPIGLTAANKQAPLLMHVEYRVSLPDHDWVVATKHKLIPSVYAGCVIKENAMSRPEAVTYTGPTYIAIRSGKHSSSTASTHAIDFQKLTTLETFREIMRNETDALKPIMMISSDGGPDENPRYPKVMAHAIDHFIKYNLDAIFMFTNAPGRSAFNRVERRMAPLSRELSGVILPHDTYGNHLDDRGRTVDSTLEKQNFRRAGEVLAEIWNNVLIDKKSVVAEYIEPNASAERFLPDVPSQEWCSKHVRQSQYLLQVVKCDDRDCCREFRSSLRTILPKRFLTAPFPILQTPHGLKIPKPEEHDGKTFASFLLRQSLNIAPQYYCFHEIPYDLYCPSLSSNPKLIKDRTCIECELYFSSKRAVTLHKSSLHKKPKSLSKQQEKDKEKEEKYEEEEKEEEEWHINKLNNAESIPIITVDQSANTPWTEEDYEF